MKHMHAILKNMVHLCNNALVFMHDDGHDQGLIAFNIWDVTI
jgi:hypothetical protein